MGKYFLTKELKTHNGEVKAWSINGAGKIGKPYAKKKKRNDYSLFPGIKINSKQLKGLNITPETLNYIEENIGAKLMDLGLGEDLITDSEGKGSKCKINEWDSIKLKSFYTAKEPTQLKVKQLKGDEIYKQQLNMQGVNMQNI